MIKILKQKFFVLYQFIFDEIQNIIDTRFYYYFSNINIMSFLSLDQLYNFNNICQLLFYIFKYTLNQ